MSDLSSPLRVCLLLAVAVLLAGCGSAPEQIGTSGVDGLSQSITVPDPDDFVTGVDNVWLALVPGRVWRYDVVNDPRSRTSTRTVLTETREVAGVAATVVRTVMMAPDGDGLSTAEEFFAQDRQGNVWLFGASGVRDWQVGEGDEPAVLAMAARPRHGDGYAVGYLDGRVTRTATVLATDASTVTPYAAYENVVLIETTPEGSSPSGVVSSSVSAHARGVGLISQRSPGSYDLELVDLSG